MAESGGRRRGGLLIAISGARSEVLEQCPTERIKFQSLGWAILITCGLATLSMWFALTSAMGFNAVMSFPIAVVWGLIIMGIDRWLVTSMPLDGKRKFLIAAPRVALAILLGSLISTPIVLRIFESEINNQISVIKETDEANFLSSQQHSSIQARVTQWQNTVNNLQAVIVSKGAKPINPTSDPVVQGLATQLANERKVAATDYTAWQCQLYGGCGAPKGNGPLAQASQARYDNDETQIASLTREITAREQLLQATDANSQTTRLQQAQRALPNAQAQLTAAQAEENSLLNNFQATNNSTNGLLIRLKALDQLSAGSSTLQTARILLFLLFLVIEILPVTVKLLQPPGNYERILRKQIENEYREAQWNLGGGPSRPGAPRSVGLGDTDDPTHSSANGNGFARSSRRHGRDPLDAELESVWNTKVESVGGWAHRANTAYQPRPDDLTGPNRLDDELRGLSDTRSGNGLDELDGGIERRYGDEEL
jgi:Domain of unknown function (DUF4407)